MFRVGDKVKVVSEFSQCPDYLDWVFKHAHEYASIYCDSDHMVVGDTGIVKVIAKSGLDNSFLYFVVSDSGVTLSFAGGLELIDGGFSKSDLEVGMVTRFRNGIKSIVFKNTTHSEESCINELLLVSEGRAFTGLEVYNEHLEHDRRSEFDIVEIKKFKHIDDMFEECELDDCYSDLDLVWTRERPAQYIIGSTVDCSRLNNSRDIMWENNGLKLRKGDLIEVIDNGETRRVEVAAVIDGKKVKSSSSIIEKVAPKENGKRRVRYSEGDKVVIRDDLVPGEYYGGMLFMDDMYGFLGKVTVITHDYFMKYKLKGIEWVLTDTMIDHDKTRALVRREYKNALALKTGMVIKFKNGVKSIVLLDNTRPKERFDAEVLLISEECGTMNLSHFHDDLTHKTNNDYNIIEVRRFNDAADILRGRDLDGDFSKLDLIWARNESIQHVVGCTLDDSELGVWKTRQADCDVGDIVGVEDADKGLTRVVGLVSEEEIDIVARMIRGW